MAWILLTIMKETKRIDNNDLNDALNSKLNSIKYRLIINDQYYHMIMPAEERSLMSILLLLSKVNQNSQSINIQIKNSIKNKISGITPIMFTYEIEVKNEP